MDPPCSPKSAGTKMGPRRAPRNLPRRIAEANRVCSSKGKGGFGKGASGKPKGPPATNQRPPHGGTTSLVQNQ